MNVCFSIAFIGATATSAALISLCRIIEGPYNLTLSPQTPTISARYPSVKCTLGSVPFIYLAFYLFTSSSFKSREFPSVLS